MYHFYWLSTWPLPRKANVKVKMLAEDFADDVFVDFFNTFMNLPVRGTIIKHCIFLNRWAGHKVNVFCLFSIHLSQVFGQTPLYIQSESRWYLCPEIPIRKVSFLYPLWIQNNNLWHYCTHGLITLSLCRCPRVMASTSGLKATACPTSIRRSSTTATLYAKSCLRTPPCVTRKVPPHPHTHTLMNPNNKKTTTLE